MECGGVMLKPAVDEDDEDAEFVDSYDQLLDRFAESRRSCAMPRNSK